MTLLRLAGMAFCVVFLSGCIGIVYEETGLPLVEEDRALVGFDRIIIDDNAQVDITVGQDYSVRVRGPEGYLQRINTRVLGDALVIDQEEMNLSPEEVVIMITMPALHGIDYNAAGDVKAYDIESDFFELSINGMGSMYLEGVCDVLKVTVDGVGDLEASKFRCQDVDLRFDGVGSAEVYASNKINADVSGIGSVDVYGNPRYISKDASGIGSFDIHK